MYICDIPLKLPSLNDYINTLKAPNGKYKGSKFKKEVDESCYWCLIKHRPQLRRICTEPIIVWFRWYEKTKRRDLDNVYSGAKYILDAMQKAHIIDNDNYAHIKGVYNSIIHGKGQGVQMVVYSLREYEEFLKDYVKTETERLKGEQNG